MWFQFFRFVRMIVRAVFPLMLVPVFLSVARMGMLVLVLVLMFVFVDVVVLMNVRGLVVGVLVCMSMSVLVLMLVAVIVLTFHWIPPSSKLRTKTGSQPESQTERHHAPGSEIVLVISPVQSVLRADENRRVLLEPVA